MTELHYAWLLLALHLLMAVASAGHALLYKRDPRAALGWIAVCIAYPFVGPIFYYLFGINRLRTRAHQIKGAPARRLKSGYERPEISRPEAGTGPVVSVALDSDLSALAKSTEAVTLRALVEGNRLQAFYDGESTYAAMLKAIDLATISVCLSSYIFETNSSGRAFIKAMAAANKRGVEVCVLLDGVGELYSFPRAGTLLEQQGIKIARFIPPRLIPPTMHINLRNHRKLLLVDGKIGFTGGMNIGDRHLHQQPEAKNYTVDIHFQVEGPVVGQLQATFDEDWLFAAGSPRRRQLPEAVPQGKTVCRVITDGPNEDIGKLVMIISGAASLARKRISIMTPYFLPPAGLISSLQAAALRGVEVSIILPQKSNLAIVDWATRNMLWELLQYGVRVYFQPPPFAHSKLLLVDENYAHIGSANMDPRSLRLNFELVVEVFDKSFVSGLCRHFDRIRNISREESLAGVDARSLPVRLRDATAWLFSPYL